MYTGYGVHVETSARNHESKTEEPNSNEISESLLAAPLGPQTEAEEDEGKGRTREREGEEGLIPYFRQISQFLSHFLRTWTYPWMGIKGFETPGSKSPPSYPIHPLPPALGINFRLKIIPEFITTMGATHSVVFPISPDHCSLNCPLISGGRHCCAQWAYPIHLCLTVRKV